MADGGGTLHPRLGGWSDVAATLRKLVGSPFWFFGDMFSTIPITLGFTLESAAMSVEHSVKSGGILSTRMNCSQADGCRGVQ